MKRLSFPHTSRKFDKYDFINHSEKGPKGHGQRDAQILEDVKEVLYMAPIIDASEVEVTVRGGCVYLTGLVENRRAKKDAEHIVEQVSGVVDVQNEIQIKGSEDFLSRLTGDAKIHRKHRGLIGDNPGLI